MHYYKCDASSPANLTADIRHHVIQKVVLNQSLAMAEVSVYPRTGNQALEMCSVIFLFSIYGVSCESGAQIGLIIIHASRPVRHIVNITHYTLQIIKENTDADNI